ncbi:MAG: hypothetical protein Q9191_000368 [Dirinaria sp. TL-2023a]
MDSGRSNSRKRGRTEEEATTSSKRQEKSSNNKSSAYDPNFEAHLNRFGIFSEGQSKAKPSNIDDIKRRLTQRRPSLSPSRFCEEDFTRFQNINWEVPNENTATVKTFPVIAGSAEFETQFNVSFQNLEDLTDGTIKKAQPDFYDGIRPSEVNNKVLDALDSYINPSSKFGTPCMPNLFGEWKGPAGSHAVCKRQALYDGALGARAMRELRSYAGHEISKNEACYTLTATYNTSPASVFIYAHHCTPSSDPAREYDYHMTRVGGWIMDNDYDGFRDGASALRNAREWAKEQRDELVAAANAV